jgi:hypothetical protein
MTETRLVLNGIDAATGQYLVPPMDIAEAAEIIRSHPTPKVVSDTLSTSLQSKDDPHLGLPFTVRPEVVAEAEWGVVFHRDERRTCGTYSCHWWSTGASAATTKRW